MRVWPVENAGAAIIDPPWRYGQYTDAAHGAASAAYACMDVREIARIPVGALMAPGAAVALWTTGPKLADGSTHVLLDAWGLTGKTLVPWLKNAPKTRDLATNMGIWFMGNAEYILFAVKDKNPGQFARRRGKLGVLTGSREAPVFWPRNAERADFDAFDPDSGACLLAPKARRHSEKPCTLHEYMETFDGPRVELFARAERPGWTCLGFDTGWRLGPDGAGILTTEA